MEHFHSDGRHSTIYLIGECKMKGLFRLSRALLTLATLLVLSGLVTTAALGAPARNPEVVDEANRHTWTFERVDAPQAFSNLTNRSLRLDSNNNPRIAYGGDHLYYARFDGTSWKV